MLGGLLGLAGISWPGGSIENTGLIIALIVGAYLVILWLSAVVWTARDIHQRTPEPLAQAVFTLIVLIFNFPGLVIYRVLRPPLTLQEAEEHRLESSALRRELEQTRECAGCGYPIAADYLACPSCMLAQRYACNECDRVLEPAWQICPWCLNPAQPPTAPAAAPPASPAPAAAAPQAAAAPLERPEPAAAQSIQSPRSLDRTAL